MVSKRRLGVSMLLLGLAFVGAFHAVLAVAYDTGLASVGAGLAGLSVITLMVVNLPALGEGSDDEGADTDADVADD